MMRSTVTLLNTHQDFREFVLEAEPTLRRALSDVGFVKTPGSGLNPHEGFHLR